jgi:hypothetical protein
MLGYQNEVITFKGQYFVVFVNNYVSSVYFGLNSGHENGRFQGEN